MPQEDSLQEVASAIVAQTHPNIVPYSHSCSVSAAPNYILYLKSVKWVWLTPTFSERNLRIRK